MRSSNNSSLLSQLITLLGGIVLIGGLSYLFKKFCVDTGMIQSFFANESESEKNHHSAQKEKVETE